MNLQVPEEDKPYLVILTETWLDAPIKLANGTVLNHEDVIKNRSKTAQSFYNGKHSVLNTTLLSMMNAIVK